MVFILMVCMVSFLDAFIPAMIGLTRIGSLLGRAGKAGSLLGGLHRGRDRRELGKNSTSTKADSSSKSSTVARTMKALKTSKMNKADA